MRRTLPLLVVLIALMALPSADLFACGDKYLSIGRGARFQRGYVSLHPVTVAVFKSNVTGRKSFLSRLKIAGHRLTVTDDVAKLEAMLTTGKYDVLLADYENVAMIDAMLSRLRAKPLFLPVIADQSSLSQDAQRKYGCLLNAETRKKQKNFLAVIDEAVAAKMKAMPVVCGVTEM